VFVLIGIKILELLRIPPFLSLGGTELGLNGGLTAVDVEAPIGGNIGGLGPVGLLKPAPSG
jgi:hypothetical protein